MAISYLKSIFKLIAGVIVFLILLVLLFFFMMSYTSPVREAGRDYRQTVRSYRNEEIETVEDVYERIDLIDSHYYSTTFDKVQGGEKTAITPTDMETLFGEPHDTFEQVNMTNADTVNQYHFEDFTINFHQGYQTIGEFVVENYTETYYNPEILDRLFIEAMVYHQTHYEDEYPYEPISKEEAAEMIGHETPTRYIHRNGWNPSMDNRLHYFDTGEGDYAPTDSFSLHFEESKNQTNLRILARRYPMNRLEENTSKEEEERKDALSAIREHFNPSAPEEPEETIKVSVFSEAFGAPLAMYYNIRSENLTISWVWDSGDEFREVSATAPVNDRTELSNMEDLDELEVENECSIFE